MAKYRLNKLAEEISNHLHTIKIGEDESRIVWTDNAPEHLKEWFQDISGEYTGHSFSELDEVYRVLSDLCDIITDMGEDVTEDEVTDRIYENEWAYIYNSDLLDWVNESLYRISDVDEAISNGAPGIIEAIQMAMHDSRSQMASSFLSAMLDKEEV